MSSRKRTISEANITNVDGTIPHRSRGDDTITTDDGIGGVDQAIDDQHQSGGGGLRRRRIIGGNGSNEDAPSTNGDSSISTTAKGEPTIAPSSQISSSSAPSHHHPMHHKSVVPLSMQLMRPFWLMSCCPDPYCQTRQTGGGGFTEDAFFAGNVVGRLGGHSGNNISASSSSKGTPAENSPIESRSKQDDDGDVNVSGNADNDGNGNANDHGTGNGAVGSPPGTNGAMASFKRAANNNLASNNQAANPLSNNPPVSSRALRSSFASDGNSQRNNTTNIPLPSATATLAVIPNNTLYKGDGSNAVTIEQILHEYASAARIYGVSSRLNPGVLATIRFSLPILRVSGNFHDADMLALAEILIKHCNGALGYIKRLDFTIAGKEGKDGGSKKKGIRSHGAYALARVLEVSEGIEEVYLSGNRVGPYGGSAIFVAVAGRGGKNKGSLRTLLMRGCRIGERGALTFVNEVLERRDEEGTTDGSGSSGGGYSCGLREVDLSACRIGFRGCYAIEEALKRMAEREDGTSGGDDERLSGTKEAAKIVIDLEGNMIFPEVMNCVTHGLGILLCTKGTYLLHEQIAGQPSYYTTSCTIYSASLIVLYTSSTLFHSFFALRRTKFIFKVLDRCAIYLLISGSYTPFLMIALHHEPRWSLNLLLFIWTCAISGVVVEATCLHWEHKSKFSLAMYLGMGWSCIVCVPDLVEVLPPSALGLIIAGGVSYTGGV